jgi:hypothetical protein
MISGFGALLVKLTIKLIDTLVKNKMVSLAVPLLGILVSCLLLLFGKLFVGFVYYVVCSTGSVIMITSGVLFIIASICQVYSTINMPPRKKAMG